jgi:hypothetical protein
MIIHQAGKIIYSDSQVMPYESDIMRAEAEAFFYLAERLMKRAILQRHLNEAKK